MAALPPEILNNITAILKPIKQKLSKKHTSYINIHHLNILKRKTLNINHSTLKRTTAFEKVLIINNAAEIANIP